MVEARDIGLFIGVALPSLLLMLASVDAVLVVAQDVFLVSLIQVALVGVAMWKFQW